MNKNMKNHILKIFIAVGVFLFGNIPFTLADIYINVLAVNGSDAAKSSSIKFDLPGEITADDIEDTNGLQLDYSVDDAAYYVYGNVKLNAKETKTFRIHVKDKWMVTPSQVDDLRNEIEKGYESLGKPHDPANAEILKTRLESKIDYILNLQSTNAESIDKRIDSYRTYVKEMKRIQNDALNVEYWRSDPSVADNPKLIHLNIDVKNPTKRLIHYKHKHYLPEEVKPENVVEAGDFEVRFDQTKQLPFLFKEEDILAGQEKKYLIGIIDIWSIEETSLNYLKNRANYAYDFLKDTKFQDSAKFLMDRITTKLQDIETSQAVQRPILDHISAFRVNKSNYNDTEKDVETLEKLLAVFREDLEKSKVENVLRKIQSLKSVSDVSKVMLNKKFEKSTAWNYIGWILLFFGILTIINFAVWLIRSKDKKIKEDGAK